MNEKVIPGSGARKDFEQQLGRSIITSQIASQLDHVVTQMIEVSASAVNDESVLPTDEKS